MMMLSRLGACLLAFLPCQALALPATFTTTAANSVASFQPGVVASDFCAEQSYTDKTTADSALVSDCKLLRTWANNTNGIFVLDSTFADFSWTLRTNGTCTVAIKNPSVGSDGKTRIGNKDLVQILDHVLAASAGSPTVEYQGTWKCGGDGSYTAPEWWLKKADSSSSSSIDAAPQARFFPSTDDDAAAARDIHHHHRQADQDDNAEEVAPFVPCDAPVTTCSNSSFIDLTTPDSPKWDDCQFILSFADPQRHNGTWTLPTGTGSSSSSDDNWWRLSNATTSDASGCELVMRNYDGSPPVGNDDVYEVMSYVQTIKNAAKGQRCEYKGGFVCGEENTNVEWWLRNKQ